MQGEGQNLNVFFLLIMYSWNNFRRTDLCCISITLEELISLAYHLFAKELVSKSVQKKKGLGKIKTSNSESKLQFIQLTQKHIKLCSSWEYRKNSKHHSNLRLIILMNIFLHKQYRFYPSKKIQIPNSSNKHR